SSPRSTCIEGSSSMPPPAGRRSSVVDLDMMRSRMMVWSIGLVSDGRGSGLLPRVAEGLGLVQLLLIALLQGLDRPADAAVAALLGRSAAGRRSESLDRLLSLRPELLDVEGLGLVPEFLERLLGLRPELVHVDDLVDLDLHVLLEGSGARADAVGDAPFGGLTAGEPGDEGERQDPTDSPPAPPAAPLTTPSPTAAAASAGIADIDAISSARGSAMTWPHFLQRPRVP